MNKQILVPLDGSKLAEMILPHALAYARANNMEVMLLTLVAPPSAMTSTAWGVGPAAQVWEGWEHEVENSCEYLTQVAKKLQPLGVNIHTHVIEDDPTRAIAGYAEQHPEIALIAMSTHGRSGLGRWVFGSVAEQVLHSSPVPLLVVRPVHEQNIFDDIQIPEYKSFLVPLDGSEFAAQALTQATAFAQGLHINPAFTLISAVPEHLLGIELAPIPAAPDDWTYEKKVLASYLEHKKEQLVTEGFAVDTVLEYGPPADAILRVADHIHPDLIVMSTHGRSGLSRLWLGSIAMKVVHTSTCPVLLVRARERVKSEEHDKDEAEVKAVPAY